MSVDVELELLTATAVYLDAQGVGTYLPDGGYSDSDTAIVFGEVPLAPDRAIGLTVYDSQDEVRQPISKYRVQFWVRGSAGSTVDAGSIAGRLFDALQGIQDRPWGDHLWLVQCERLSLSPQGVDANKRQERAENYLFKVNSPASAGRSD